MSRAAGHTSFIVRASDARDASFAAADTGASGVAWIGVALVAGTFTMFNLFGNAWPGAAQAHGAGAGTQAMPALSDAYVVPDRRGDVADAADGAMAADAAGQRTPAYQLVTKCVRDGATSFSDQPCAPGAQAQQIAVDPDQNLTSGLPRVKTGVLLAGAQAAAAKPGGTETPALHQLQCEALDAKVRTLDAWESEPVPLQQQTRLALLRRETREAQLRLDC